MNVIVKLIVIGALGTDTKGLLKNQEDLRIIALYSPGRPQRRIEREAST